MANGYKEGYLVVFYASLRILPLQLSMSSNRSHFRNIHFYDATKVDEDALGGLIQNGSITEENFLDMLGILLVTESVPIRVEHRTSGHIVSGNNRRLDVGVYDIYCDSRC